ncbi:MAG: M43 family zinc metalloprotease, partial [Bacteroidota bacterium]
FGQDLVTKQKRLPCLNKSFSIIAHIVQDSLGEVNVDPDDIQAGIDTLNKNFANICVSFEICEFRIIENFQYDTLSNPEWEELQVKYHERNRINMFFVSASDDAPICGFATLAGITQVDQGGIVILKGCISPESKTIPHEMGHYFGLLHTFEGEGAELVDGSNCVTEGDFICDTPADPFVVGDPVSQYVSVEDGCRFISPLQDANGEFYRPDVGNMMSYYPDECRCGFTYEQYIRMAETCESASEKMW